ncbi:hypothetical protein NQ317_009327 [Molorchus minor]|uniref:Uncharacterized protein n=1 Tax=Molorchus minor TaxID=1323400 RepID=A0ABQ9JHB3_9CUCU|nr:hypothetical protein NQ317_009327 [Molorchus minor]
MKLVGKLSNMCAKCLSAHKPIRTPLASPSSELLGDLEMKGEIQGDPGRSKEIRGDPGRSGGDPREIQGDPREIRGDPGDPGRYGENTQAKGDFLYRKM